MALAAADLKPLYQRRLAPNLVKVPLFYALWIGAGVVAWNSTQAWLTWTCYFFMGFIQMGIMAFMHECAHHLMFRKRWKNTAFGMFTVIPFLISFTSFKEDHLAHHMHNRSPRDPDAAFYGTRRPIDFLLFYAYCFAGGILLVVHFGFLYPITALRGNKALVHWAEMAMHAVVLSAVVMAASAAGILGRVLEIWLYPLLVFTTLNSIRAVAEHYGTPYNAGQLAGTRTITSNPLVSYFWNNINWHIGHHVYPAVPWYNLQKLHHLMLPDIKAHKAHVAGSYIMVFLDALLTGPESAQTVSKRNPEWQPAAARPDARIEHQAAARW